MVELLNYSDDLVSDLARIARAEGLLPEVDPSILWYPGVSHRTYFALLHVTRLHLEKSERYFINSRIDKRLRNKTSQTMITQNKS